MADRIRRLFARRDDDGPWGTVAILILICVFFPLLSLIVAVEVANPAN